MSLSEKRRFQEEPSFSVSRSQQEIPRVAVEEWAISSIFPKVCRAESLIRWSQPMSAVSLSESKSAPERHE
ncbi:hypothetical protein AVEN_1810-1 [Araneus ventricosus]|uniref:Uncharacterized protein n=1 Tax=Araneus ventricosus TaxID=182803 RepID=A0A4Y2HY46_ARAVE|nr:hypothetical protein AVEN_1810-1 [Araneus ventricosus]